MKKKDESILLMFYPSKVKFEGVKIWTLPRRLQRIWDRYPKNRRFGKNRNVDAYLNEVKDESIKLIFYLYDFVV